MKIGEHLIKISGNNPINALNTIKPIGDTSTGIPAINSSSKSTNIMKNTVKGIEAIKPPNITNNNFEIKPMKVASVDNSSASYLAKKIESSGYNPLGYENTGKLVIDKKITPNDAALFERVNHESNAIKNDSQRNKNALRMSIAQAVSVILKKNPISSLAGSALGWTYNGVSNSLDVKNDDKIINEAIRRTADNPHSKILGKYDFYRKNSDSNDPKFKEYDKKIFNEHLSNRNTMANNLFDDYVSSLNDEDREKVLLDLKNKYNEDKSSYINEGAYTEGVSKDMDIPDEYFKANDDLDSFIESSNLNKRFGINEEETNRFRNIRYRKKGIDNVPESLGQAAGGIIGYGLTSAIGRLISKDPSLNNNRYLLGLGTGAGGFLGRMLSSKFNNKKENEFNRKIISTKQEV